MQEQIGEGGEDAEDADGFGEREKKTDDGCRKEIVFKEEPEEKDDQKKEKGFGVDEGEEKSAWESEQEDGRQVCRLQAVVESNETMKESGGGDR